MFDEQWFEEANSQCSVLRDPATMLQEAVDDMDAQDIRDALLNYLYLQSP